MGIQFSDGKTNPILRIPILKVTGKIYVRFLQPPSASVRVFLHYMPGGSVPCYGEECRTHAYEPVEYGYAAVMVGEWESAAKRTLTYRPAILPVTAGAMDLLTEDRRKQLVSVWRLGERPNGAMKWAVKETLLEDSLEGFDLLPRLLALWGKRATELRVNESGASSPSPALLKFEHDDVA